MGKFLKKLMILFLSTFYFLGATFEIIAKGGRSGHAGRGAHARAGHAKAGARAHAHTHARAGHKPAQRVGARAGTHANKPKPSGRGSSASRTAIKSNRSNSQASRGLKSDVHNRNAEGNFNRGGRGSRYGNRRRNDWALGFGIVPEGLRPTTAIVGTNLSGYAGNRYSETEVVQPSDIVQNEPIQVIEKDTPNIQT